MNTQKLRILALTVMLFLGLTGAALAQGRWYVASTPLQQRQTGVTETVGDIALITSNPAAFTIPAGATLAVSIVPFAAAITNDPVVNGVNVTLNGGPVPGATLRVGDTPNTLTITFEKDLVVQPGSSFRIRAIRVNVQVSGVTFPDQIRAQLTSNPPDAFMFEVTNLVPVANPLPTLQVTFGTIPNLLNCLTQSVTRTITVTEQFPGVFTSQTQEASLSNTPSPTNPTRLEILLTTVPGGLTTDVPAAVPLLAQSVSTDPRLVFNPTLSTPPTSGTRYTSAVTRDISLIYDVTGSPDLGQIESAVFTLNFTTTGQTTTQLLGCVGAQVRLVPLSTTPERARAGDTGPRRIVPRFIDPLQPPTPRTLVCVLGCTCNLKFPYVTNKDGLDTTIIIANTTADPYGTPGQSGTVDLYFYGQDAPNPPRATLPAVPAGGIAKRNLAPDLAPNFQGYIIAIANFQFCHGTAFIIDGALGSIAHGYTALLIPDPIQFGGRRQPGFPLAGTISGTSAGGIISGTVTINDAYGERLVH